MDMSLPSSYDTISNPQASSEDRGTLLKEDKGGGGMVSSKSKAKKEAKAVKQLDEEDKKLEKIKTVDSSLPSYSDNTVAKQKSTFAL